VGQPAKHQEVIEVKIVAGVHAEAERVRETRRARICGE